MKKIIAIVLFAVICLSFSGCDSRDKIRKQADTAPELSIQTYADLLSENEARAKAEFDGKVYSYTGEVYDIGNGYCNVKGACYIDVYLEEEDLVKLNKGEEYTFVGVFEHEAICPNLKDAIVLDK